MSNSIRLGSLVTDRDATDSDEAIVVNLPEKTAVEWEVWKRNKTVAEDNPAYPTDDDVAIVVHRDDLEYAFEYYSGVRPLRISELRSQGTPHYAFPISRLEYQGDRLTHTLPIDDIRPSPYHARNFAVDENQAFIDETREQGEPIYPPLVRVCNDHFEIVNGHKRLWVSHVAGLEEIECRCIYLDDETAARTWANNHLSGYSDREYLAASSRLRERLGPTAEEILTRSIADGGSGDGRDE